MNNSLKVLILVSLASTICYFACSTENIEFRRDEDGKIIIDPLPSWVHLSPEESMKRIYLQKGYRLELVASEPMIHEPVAIAWDPNGRMYVAEMNTYMQDINGTGEMKRVCKVKRLEDTDGDGKMDKSVVFIDSLLLPRMILPLDDRVLVAETNDNSIYSYRDTDGDGIADEKEVVFTNEVPSTSNLEHQRSGLIWNLDNRIYVTVENVRYRYENGQLVAENLEEYAGGQWGLTSDDYGRLYFSSAGGEIPALGFQQNPYYGGLTYNDQFDSEFKAVWPIVPTPDVEGGLNRLRLEDSTLNHFTASTGQSIFRGSALPKDLIGDLLICEPVGRLIRRAKVTNTDGKITLENAYYREEFIASTDMNFRPVNTQTGPDGHLYIVDMYRGIIQESAWTKKGSYLRPKILERGLDKNIGKGRIYRLVYDGLKSDSKQPRMLSETSEQLVAHLEHPNGWWRDNAQKLLVLRGDTSVAGALRKIALGSTTDLSRIHALWTLEGLDVLDLSTILAAMDDKAFSVRKTAVWIADEAKWKANDHVFARLQELKSDPSADVRLQLLLTMRFDDTERSKSLENDLLARYPNDILAVSMGQFEERRVRRAQASKEAASLAKADQQLVKRGAVIFKEFCASCHGPDGRGLSIGGGDAPAPALAENPDVSGAPDKLIKILLHGLTGPINGKTYLSLMPPMSSRDDDYIAAVLSYIRTDLGNKSSVIRKEHVKRIREQTADRSEPWTKAELDN
jgi:mono/diheme cytochrome c family protein/glucose/arabinose dehydrogenase